MTTPFFTFGGLFYWVDKHCYAGWRIQESIWTKKYRLLDPYNIKRKAGSFEECFSSLTSFLKAWELTSTHKKIVVFIHGLFQSPSCFEEMARQSSRSFETMNFSYPTLRFSLVKSAMALNVLLEKRNDIEEINFVAMGMGGLILRQAIELNPSWLPRLKRSVFLSVPNKGYAWADKYKENRFFRFLFGEAGENITQERVQNLMPMGGEFCTITGGRGDSKGFLPFFKEDNDGFLPVSAAQAENAKENNVALNKFHFFLLNDKDVLERVQNFLRRGKIGSGVRLKKEKQFSNIWDN